MAVLGFESLIATPERLDRTSLARLFDHTNLKPNSGRADIQKLCEEAAKYGFAAVCIAPRWVEQAARALSERSADTVAVCTVIGFPHGNTTTGAKVCETRLAVEAGACEIDVAISIGDLKDANDSYVERDIAEVVETARAGGAITKVILETGYLDDSEIVKGCELAVRAGADFVKTSTGFGPNGAKAEVVRLMRESVGDAVGVKAAGGIRSLADAREMVNAGATRLGCSSSVQILHEFGQSR